MVPAFLYGFGCRAGRLPPNDFLKRAWDPVCPVVDILHANDVERYSSRAYISAGDVSSTAEVPDPNPTPLNDVEILSLSMADGYRLFDAGDLRVTLQNVPLVFVVVPDTETVTWHRMDARSGNESRRPTPTPPFRKKLDAT